MGILYLIQIVVAVFVFSRIAHYVNIFGKNGHGAKKMFDEEKQLYQLQVENPSQSMQQTIAKINRMLEMRQKNQFYVSSFSIEDLINTLADSTQIKVKAYISIHLIVAFAAIYVSLIQLTPNLWKLINLNTGTDDIINLSLSNSVYLFICLFVILLTGLIMSIEYSYWYFSQNKINEMKLDLITFIDNEFQDSVMDDIRLVLSKFSEVQKQMNTDLEANNSQLTDNVKSLGKAVFKQAEFIDTYAGYLVELKKIDIENIVIDTAKFHGALEESLKVTEANLPQFGLLTKALNDTLNRTITLYGKLNEAITRDSQFKAGMEVFNDTVKHNGHITAKLLETINKVQTHINQVILTHGPKIEELDNEFFKYLEKRLQTLRMALEKNDELIFDKLNNMLNQETKKKK